MFTFELYIIEFMNVLFSTVRPQWSFQDPTPFFHALIGRHVASFMKVWGANSSKKSWPEQSNFANHENSSVEVGGGGGIVNILTSIIDMLSLFSYYNSVFTCSPQKGGNLIQYVNFRKMFAERKKGDGCSPHLPPSPPPHPVPDRYKSF